MEGICLLFMTSTQQAGLFCRYLLLQLLLILFVNMLSLVFHEKVKSPKKEPYCLCHIAEGSPWIVFVFVSLRISLLLITGLVPRISELMAKILLRIVLIYYVDGRLGEKKSNVIMENYFISL